MSQTQAPFINTWRAATKSDSQFHLPHHSERCCNKKNYFSGIVLREEGKCNSRLLAEFIAQQPWLPPDLQAVLDLLNTLHSFLSMS